jgi:hypothetical protein
MPLANQIGGPQPAVASRKSVRLARCGLVLASLGLTFATAEIVLRATGCQPRTSTVLSTFFQPHAELGWTGRPNAACQFVTSSFDVKITHGPDGFRTCPGAALEGEPQPASEVVWCLGDSYVWGWGVPDGETFVDQLNRRNARRRVFRNLGVSGFNSVQEYLLLRDMLAKEPAPDHVLLTFCENDLADNLADDHPRFSVDGDRFEIEAPRGLSYARQFGSWLKRHSLAFNYLDFYIARARNRLHGGSTAAGTSRPDPAALAALELQDAPPWTESVSWRALHHAYGLIQAMCAERQIQFSVVWQSEMPAPRQLARVMDDLSIPLLDLSGSLGEQRQVGQIEGPLLFPWDGHYTPRGHAMVAKAIESHLSAPAVAQQER